MPFGHVTDVTHLDAHYLQGASSSIVAVIAVVAVIVVSAAVFVGIIYRRRVQQSKWLSTEQALSELRAAVGVSGPDASSDPSDGPYLKMDVDDQDYIVDGLDVIAETPLFDSLSLLSSLPAPPPSVFALAPHCAARITGSLRRPRPHARASKREAP
jgi:hypothetical protein